VAFGGLQSSTTIVSTTLIVLELDHRESSPNEEGSMHGLASSGTGEPGMFSLIDLYLDNAESSEEFGEFHELRNSHY